MSAICVDLDYGTQEYQYTETSLYFINFAETFSYTHFLKLLL